MNEPSVQYDPELDVMITEMVSPAAMAELDVMITEMLAGFDGQ